jgi:hypothetical protein
MRILERIKAFLKGEPQPVYGKERPANAVLPDQPPQRPKFPPNSLWPPPPPQKPVQPGDVGRNQLHDSCRKRGALFLDPMRYPEQSVLYQYARDAQHGERLLLTCWRCGYRWAKPVRNTDNDRSPVTPARVVPDIRPGNPPCKPWPETKAGIQPAQPWPRR